MSFEFRVRDRELKYLRSLRLVGTRISDDAVPHLRKMEALKYLYVKDTRLTKQGLNLLAEALPECKTIY